MQANALFFGTKKIAVGNKSAIKVEEPEDSIIF